MKIRELFERDVTRDIPPVVYFHEQSPAKVLAEVSEYIVTGGYPEGDPRARRVKAGIHEQFVHLLKGIHDDLCKRGGPSLPASWISGFYGSGKSSFAKLLGLALDGVELPDGTALAQALLLRDDSPRRDELVAGWNQLIARVKPIAVVFDIGGVARDNEQIAAAVLRQLQIRLGYCSTSNLVAEHELRLERDGEWERFLKAARETLGKEWSAAKNEAQADDHFSHVLHVMNPERYRDPTTWIDSRAGSRSGAGTGAQEIVEAIEAMLSSRAEGRTLFIVVDEVSQYVHRHDERMLKLSSFVSGLGQKLKGAAWLIATGQQKLEEQSESQNMGRLQDRFPPHLRVHLGTTNIRDVVHKRLLKKKPACEATLRALFQQHRGELRLYGYKCEELTEEDFVEVYPMLPEHIDLLMQITSSLRTRSSRIQGDDHAIRGLLQLLGELFREQKLAEREVGDLVTLDAIFEVQHSALDADVQTTLARIANHPELRDDVLAQRAAKAVSLLELIQEQVPTTSQLVGQCLYSRLGEGNLAREVSDALDRLCAQNLVSRSERHGFKVQSSAGQEWQRERDEIGVSQETVTKIVQSGLKALVGAMQERPRWRGRAFPLRLWYSDGRQASDVKLQDPRDDAAVEVDFRFLARREEQGPAVWVQKSDQGQLRNRLIWIAGSGGDVEMYARQLGRSARMLELYRPRRESLTREKQRVLIEEEARFEELDGRVRTAIAEAFHDGSAFFRAQPLRPKELGGAFGSALSAIASRLLPDLFPHFTEIAVTPTELNQLLERELMGPSPKFMETGLGILSLDAGRYVANCTGLYPTRIVEEVRSSGGLTGQTLVSTFMSPPFGCAPDLIKACCAGLLRGKKLRIRPEHGDDITSIQDPGVRDLFAKDRDFRRAEFFPAVEGEVTQRDRVAIITFFETFLDVRVEPDDEPIADATFLHFPAKRERLREVEHRFNQLPGRPALPAALQKLGRALEDCCRWRQVLKTVVEVKRNLDTLRDGIEQLGICYSELTQEAIDTLVAADRSLNVEIAQLRQAGALSVVEADFEAIAKQLESERPWREVAQIKPVIERVRATYIAFRGALLNQQNAIAEGARSRVKSRAGFELLTADQSHRVLRPIVQALVDTTPEAIAPTLSEVSNSFASSIQRAEELANDLLDEELDKIEDKKVVKVDPQIRGREVSSDEELRLLLVELEQRLSQHLAKGKRVRIV